MIKLFFLKHIKQKSVPMVTGVGITEAEIKRSI